MAVIDRARPFDGVTSPNAGRLRADPPLEVLRPVVVADVVEVVFGLPVLEVPTQEVLGDEDVLGDVPATSRSGGRGATVSHDPPVVGPSRRQTRGRGSSSAAVLSGLRRTQIDEIRPSTASAVTTIGPSAASTTSDGVELTSTSRAGGS